MKSREHDREAKTQSEGCPAERDGEGARKTRSKRLKVIKRTND
jgi:hypothetical protein